MTIKEAIRILTIATDNADLSVAVNNSENYFGKLNEACQLAADELRALLAFKKKFDDLYGTGLNIANWHMNGSLEPFDTFYEEACNDYERARLDKR